MPAKHIKWRFDETEQKEIEKTEWWKYDIKELKEKLDYFRKETDSF